ncbi:cytochrome P450 89A2-like [Oryza glaberrima]|uniref:Cytochrome P450 n=1 Tax=Oryza glaberrima TaxID=4538 RepID=I1PIT8_ORYGL|nr:cytochrome P450 89A2-like [Oryza glaberrima]AHW98604.1 cytochrome P450 [Oryza glaberrima]
MDTSVLLLVLFVFTLLCCLALLRRAARRARAPAAVQLPTIEISDAAVARRALVDYADVFANRPFLPFPVALVTGRRSRRSDNLTSVPYGPHWCVLRRNLTAGIFHPSRLGLLAPLQRDAVDDLVAGISESAGGGAVTVVVRDAAYTAVFRLAARMCFGDGVGERQVLALRRVIRAFVLDVGVANNVFPVSTSTALARLRRWRRIRRLLSSRRRQAELYLPLIDERRRRMAARRRDRDADGGTFRPYVDALIELRVPGDGESTPTPLTDDEMVSLLMEFLAASTESVVSCIEWTLAHLVIDAEAQNKLRREVADVGDGEHIHGGRAPYMRAVILESLRLHPPVPFVIREVVGGAAAPVLDELAAMPMPGGGARVHFVIGDIGRDGKAWKDPEEFRPERFMAGGEAEGVGPVPGPKEVRMMPFGAGRRSCPGMGVAVAHVGLFVAALVREFEWTPAAGGGVDLTQQDDFFNVMRTPLRARATPRPRAPA